MENAAGRVLRLIRRQRLFFGFALGANRSLKSQPRAVLPGDVLHRPARRTNRLGLRGRRALQA